MATQNFKIKNGLSIGDHNLIDSDGNITLPTGASLSVNGGTLDTDDVEEGNTNVYYTDTRARAAVSASGDLNYDSGTGELSFSETVTSISLNGNSLDFVDEAGNTTNVDVSSIDADTVDGLQASSFLRSDTDDVFTGNLTTGADNHITFGPNSSWGSYLRVGGNGWLVTGTEMASMATTDGNLHLDAAADNNSIFLNYYAGTGGVNFGNGATGIVANMSAGGVLTMPNHPSCSCNIRDHNTAGTHAGDGISALGLDSFGNFSRGGMVVSVDRVTVPVAGVYSVVAFQLNSSNNGEYFRILKNGALIVHGYNSDTTVLHDLNVSTNVVMAANDFIQIAYTSATGDRWEGAHSNLSIHLIG